MFVNGATDAPVLLSAPILSGALSRRRAALLSALGNGAGLLAGVFFMGGVAESVRELALLGDGEKGLVALAAVLASAVIWAAAAALFGIPTSESHALLFALAGASAALGRGADITRGVGAVLAGLLLSLGGGFALCRAFCRIAEKILCPKKERRLALPVLAAAMSFLHGAQDGQKFTALFFLALSFGGVSPSPLWILPPFLALSAGSGFVGGKILDAFGEKGAISEKNALSAELATALCLALCTLFGLPVSTTHLKSAAMSSAGGGGMTGGAVAAWLLTCPACFLLAFGLTRALGFFF